MVAQKNQMKAILYPLIFLVFLSACKRCEDKVCAEISAEYKSWIPFQLTDTIHFTTSSGKAFSFVVTQMDESSATTQHCFRSLSSCSCVNCSPYCSMTSEGDSSRNNLTKYSIRVSNSSYQKQGVSEMVRKDYYLDFLDFSADFDLDIISKSNDTLVKNGIVYTGVFHSKIDTLNSNFKHFMVSEIYGSKQFSVIAFYDRKTHEWYYRE